MLHTKFHGNRPVGSGEEDFFKVFTIHGHDGHLGHMTNFHSPFPRRLHIKFGFDWPSGFQSRRSLKMVDGRRTDDDRRRLDGYTISSPCEPNGSGELIMALEYIYISYKNEKVAAMLRLGCGYLAAIRYVCDNWWQQSS